MPAFTWDDSSGRYRDTAGRYLSARRVREGADATATLAADRMADAAARLRAGTITIEQFQAEMMRHVKDVHAGVSMAAYGGREQMTPSRWGTIGARVRSEYGYVRQLTADILSGTQPMTASLDARARQYAQAARITYETIQAREAERRGQTEARNILHAAESCAECAALAALGWVALAQMPRVGTRECGRHCRCTIDRRQRDQGQEAA